MLPHCLLVVLFLMRNMLSSLSLFICTLLVFIPLALVFFFISTFQQFDYDECWSQFLHISCAWGFTDFLGSVGLSFSTNLGKNFQLLFLQVLFLSSLSCSFSSPSGAPYLLSVLKPHSILIPCSFCSRSLSLCFILGTFSCFVFKFINHLCFRL